MKKKRVFSVLLAVLLAVLMPVSAMGLEGGEDAAYEACVERTLRELRALPAEDFPEPVEEMPALYAFSAEPEEGEIPDEEEEISMDVFYSDALPEDGDVVDYVEEQLFDAVQDADGTMYSQLTARQKACYNALKGVPISQILTASKGTNGYRQVKLSITGLAGTTLSGYASGGVFRLNSSGEATKKSVMTDLRAAIVSLYYDHPEMVWLHSMSYGYSSKVSSGTQSKITTANYSFALDFGGIEGRMYNEMIAAADIIARNARTLPDQYQQVKLIHDVIAKNNTYNYPVANDAVSGLPYEMAHCGYSALIPGDKYEPVCDGYSKAVKLVCDRMKILCAVPISETHMWNNIKMDDGLWYNMDVTWDDNDRDTVPTTYFLIGSQTVVNGRAFSRQTDHVEKNPFTYKATTNNLTLRFPTKNTVAYKYLGKNYPPLRFPDVPRSQWYYEYVEAAAEKSVMKGNTNGRFEPEKNITRAEFAQTVVNLVKADVSGYTGRYFSDVSTSQWYAKPIGWIKSMGIMNGDAKGTFRPDAPITREEMCVVLYNLAQSQGLSLSTTSSRFADHSRISSWARDAVYACKNMGFVKGNTGNSFEPTKNTLRCDAATVFVRYLEASGGSTQVTPKPTPTPAPSGSQSGSGSSAGTGSVVYWVASGTVYHSTKDCPSLARSYVIYYGSLSAAVSQGKASPCKVCH